LWTNERVDLERLEEVYSNDEGMSSWIEVPHQIGEMYLEQNPIVVMIILASVVVACGTCS
jgi:hypothetical protein